MAKKPVTYCILEWEDTFTLNDSWVDNDTIDLEPYIVHSAGILVKENKKELCIANGMHGTRAMGVAQIPKGCIRKIKKIKMA